MTVFVSKSYSREGGYCLDGLHLALSGGLDL